MSAHRLITTVAQGIAALEATDPRPAEAIRRTAVVRTGNGQVALAGPYTGEADATVEVRIVAGTGVVRTTTPQFSGIGTGSMSDVAVAPGTAAQTVTVVLVDSGAVAAAAAIDLGGVRLVARESGSDGNAITLTVDESAILVARTNYALTEDLPAGTTESTSGGADFGGPIGTADLVPAGAIRIRIGQDQGQTYTHWKSFASGVQTNHFRPALRRDYRTGDRVYRVTGSRTVTVTDGVTSEDYAGVVTLADLLVMIQDGSALVTVAGPIDTGRAADNVQGVQDLRLTTASLIDDAGGTGSDYAQQGPTDLAVGEAATELVEAVCTAHTAAQGAGLGAERWAVTGSVSGALGVFASGATIFGPAGRFRFTIPQRLPVDYDSDDTAPIQAIFKLSNANSQAAVAADPLRAGRAASAKSVTFTYRARPVAACDPLDTPYTRLKGVARWLGFDFITETEAFRVSLAAAYQTRLQGLYTWRSGFAAANARHETWSADKRYRMFRVAEMDLDLCDSVTSLLARALQQIYTSEAGLDAWDDAFQDAQDALAPFGSSAIEQLYPVADRWDDNRRYAPGEFVKTIQRPGWVYLCIQGGITDTQEPSDDPGSATPERADSTAYVAGDYALPATRNGWRYQCANSGTSGAGVPANTAGAAATIWTASQAYGLGAKVLPTSRNKCLYTCTSAGTSGATQPTWGTTHGGTTNDGTAVWTCTKYWTNAIGYNDGTSTIEPGDGRVYRCVTGGVSGATEPTWTGVAGEITDGTVKWHIANVFATALNATTADGGVVWKAVDQYWTGGRLYAVGETCNPGNGFRYLVTTGGTSAASEPTWPETPGTVTDGTVVWTLMGAWAETLGGLTYDGSVVWEAYEQYWEAEANYTATTDVILPWNGFKYTCTTTGTSGTAEPAWSAATHPVADGTAAWKRATVVASGAAEAVDPASVQYVSNVYTYEVASEHTEYVDPPRSTGNLMGNLFGGNLFGGGGGGVSSGSSVVVEWEPPPERIDSIETEKYVYARVWRVVDSHSTLVFSRSWYTGTLSGSEITNLEEVAQGEVEIFLQDVRNQLAGMSKVADYVRRWKARADMVLATGGVEPAFNAAAASTKDGDSELWRDVGDAWWWIAEGTDYLPIFNNVEYVSCRRNAAGIPESTQEFSVAIRVGTCAVLTDGDTMAISMGDARWGATYTTGDRLYLRTIAGAPLAATGGADADTIQTWAVAGSVDGPLDLYSSDTAAPALYADGGIAFRLSAGGIPFAAGDAWSFGIEGGLFQYRVDGGAWSADTDIGATALADGLSLAFVDGVSPSFVAGDTAAFLAEQPYAADHALVPDDAIMAWDGAGTTIVATCTGTVDAVLIALHTLPAGATVTVSDGVDLDETMTWRAGPMLLLLDEPLTNPELTIAIANATGGSIGWLWAGQAHQTAFDADSQIRRVRHAMQRGGGINAAARRFGHGVGYTVEFSGFLTQAEVTAFEAMIDAAKAAGDLPALWLPTTAAPTEAALVHLPDELEVRDIYGGFVNGASDRYLAVSMDLEPWLTA